jgi:hypothetical protein
LAAEMKYKKKKKKKKKASRACVLYKLLLFLIYLFYLFIIIMSKLVDALQQQEQAYIRRPPVHIRTSKSTSIRHNLLLSPTRTTSGSIRGPRKRTNSLNVGARDIKLLPRLEEENAKLPPQVNKRVPPLFLFIYLYN